MLMSESHSGQMALGVLFEYYEKYKGISAVKICDELDIDIEVVDFENPFSGRLLNKLISSRVIIRVPQSAWPFLREYIAYHELSHFFLMQENQWYSHTEFFYNDLECCCDAFATAMTIAREGVALLHRENYSDFFAAGMKEGRSAVDQKFTAYLASFEGKRIVNLSKAYFRPRHPDLFSLGNAIIQDGERLLKAAQK